MIEQRIIVLCLMAVATTIYVLSSVAGYPYIAGLVWIGFWGLSAYEDILAGKGFIKTNRQRLKFGLATVLALFYFLPPDTFLFEVEVARNILGLCLIAAILFLKDE